MPVTSWPQAVSAFGAGIRRSADTLNRATVGQQLKALQSHYALLRKYHANEVYERHDASHAAIAAWEGLPRAIRPIALIPRRAVEWWPGHVYPGVFTFDGLPASNGKPNMLPFDGDTPDELRLAVQQAFAWANGPRFLRRYVRTGAKLGDAFAEISVRPDRGKVYPVLIDPEYVIDLDFNDAGDITEYRLAIPMRDPSNDRPYIWGKLVTKTSITTFYDDEPRSFIDGQDAEIENEYGFVPAVWVPHVDVGGQHGASAIDGLLPTLDEYNGLLSAVDDYIMKFVHQGAIVESPNPQKLKDMLTTQAGQTPMPTRDRTRPQSGRQEVNVLPAPEGTKVHHLIQNLGLSEAQPHIDRIMSELEKTLPEIVLSEKLLEMNQVTRPGALPLVQDVQHKFDESSGNYDQGVVKLGQMCVSIMGHHINRRDFGLPSGLTEAQRMFAAFDLDSYDAGELAWSLMPRTLIPQTFGELAEEAAALERITTPSGLRHAGFSDTDIYGDGNEPEKRPGLLAEQEQARASTSDLLGRAFSGGAVV